jgi:predicted aldo/keto reductase-like oxidoreductase
MKTVLLGRTGLKASEVGFGGIPIIPLGFDQGVSIVRHCFEQGITFFDTANMYGDSEKKIGKALEDVRDKVVIATKTLERTAQGAAGHIKLSLDNLRTNRIDLYQLHNISKNEDMERILAKDGALESAEKAKYEGKINHIGFSSHDIATAVKMCRTNRFSTVQFPFNFIEHQPAGELFNTAREHHMGIIAMKPLGGGLLERADLCFKFLQKYPDVVPIPGIQSVQEADEIIGLYVNPQQMNDKDREEIEKIRSELGTRFCHRCGYCMPCEQGVKITDVMAVRSVARRLAPEILVMMAKTAVETVDNCNECGECLERCPYSLPIPEVIRENKEYFEDLVAKHIKS